MPDAEFYSHTHRRWLRRLLHGISEAADGGDADASSPRVAAAAGPPPAAGGGWGSHPGSPRSGDASGGGDSGGGGGGGGGAGSADGRFTDSFRAFHPARQGACTCWSTASSARRGRQGAQPPGSPAA